VLALAFSPDGSQLAVPFGADSGEGPDGVEILDVASGERVARLSPEGDVQSVAFSPDGSLLAGGMVDGGALLWATDGWGRVGGPLARSTAATLEVEFSPDGHTLATSHSDHSVALWDVASQEPIGPPLRKSWGEDAAVTARFTPDGARLFVLSDPGEGSASNRWRATRWEVDPELWLQRACAVAGGGLTPEQWAELVPEQDYRPVCPSG
jgi:WD40 repeat protein